MRALFTLQAIISCLINSSNSWPNSSLLVWQMPWLVVSISSSTVSSLSVRYRTSYLEAGAVLILRIQVCPEISSSLIKFDMIYNLYVPKLWVQTMWRWCPQLSRNQSPMLRKCHWWREEMAAPGQRAPVFFSPSSPASWCRDSRPGVQEDCTWPEWRSWWRQMTPGGSSCCRLQVWLLRWDTSHLLDCTWWRWYLGWSQCHQHWPSYLSCIRSQWSPPPPDNVSALAPGLNCSQCKSFTTALHAN